MVSIWFVHQCLEDAKAAEKEGSTKVTWTVVARFSKNKVAIYWNVPLFRVISQKGNMSTKTNKILIITMCKIKATQNTQRIR